MKTPERLPAPGLPGWIAAELPFERYAVDVGGYRMHVMEQGQGRPVLLVHGNPTWGWLWRKVAAALRGEPLRLIMPDLLGLGYSDRLASAAEHTLDGHGRWLGTLVEELDLRGAIAVVQDWGGAIGVLAFERQPERLAGLVALNTVLGPPRPGFRPTAFHRFARMPILSEAAFRLLGFPQIGLHLAQGDRASIRGITARAYREPLRGLGRNVAPLALARMVPDEAEHHASIPALRRCQALVEGFHGPAAIVWGDRDPILGRAFGRVQRLLPDAMVTRTQAGHFLQEEVPAEIAEAIRRVAALADARAEGLSGPPR